MPRLKTVKLLRESFVRWDEYPFNVPPIVSMPSRLRVASAFSSARTEPANRRYWKLSLRIMVSGTKAETVISLLKPPPACAPSTLSSAPYESDSPLGPAQASI